MENFDIQPFILYWGMLGALLGSAVTPHIFSRRNRDPWIGAIIGTVVGLISAEVFGRILLLALYPILPTAAPLISLAGAFVLLVPLWLWVKPLEQSGLKNGPEFYRRSHQSDGDLPCDTRRITHCLGHCAGFL
ncbi:hypothetical protein ACFLYO_03760 [Chloroflexota bacterium]